MSGQTAGESGFEDLSAEARMVDFLAVVSHEIRTPLTAIGGIGATLERRWETIGDDLRRELVGRLNANARVLDEIVSTMLDISRIESGTLTVSLQTVHLTEQLRQLTDRLSSLFNHHEVSVVAEEGLLVEADRLLIDRVVENLLVNAVRHTRAETHIWLEAGRRGDHVAVAVRDDGDGIPEHELTRLGERFYRGGDPRSRPARGTGLGLALVVEVLRLHGEELDIKSEVGRGSCFSFRLRAASSQAPRYHPIPEPSRVG
jgi:two-component system, OmpR family, phosphate regulon sensor histidine kinase PhoR